MPRGFAPSKKDANHNEVVRTLRECGYSVAEVHAVGGVWDLFVAKWNVTIAVEVKGPKGKLTEAEQEFCDNWKGLKVIARSGQDAFDQCELLVQLYGGTPLAYRITSGSTTDPITPPYIPTVTVGGN